ncbi:hypothetical protein, partial [Erythrobacter sp. HI0074]|uniref:hypothetical protein n=2 Tax=unclassified Erythrobacter TaxID=2633097 RepID=UPI0007BA05B8
DHDPDTAPTQHPQSARGTLPAFIPVPRAKERSNGWKPQVQRAFIEALADTGSVASACRQVGRAEVGAYLLRRHPKASSFRAAWQAALDLGMQRIEDVAMDRALNGVEVPVYSYGKLVGSRRVHNDRLLMFMLRNRAPERFAGGRPKALNAIGRMEKKRLKAKWRRQWEKEQRRTSPAEVRASIARKVAVFRQQMEAQLSPRTLAAYAEFERLRDADIARGYKASDDPEHPLYLERGEEVKEEPMQLPSPEAADREVEASEPKAEGKPRWRSIRDMGWD